MSSSRSGSSQGSKKPRASQKSMRQLIESLRSHRVNTLTELCRIERAAASCQNEEDAQEFQGPMTSAWDYYVTSHQFLTELRGLTRNYPFCGDIVTDAHFRVRSDPESNRSWNLAWLCLIKIQDEYESDSSCSTRTGLLTRFSNLISSYAAVEASKPEMWGGRYPEPEESEQLAQCFEYEWSQAVAGMLRHWPVPPTWY